MADIIETVAIIVQPHQEISRGKTKKYGGVERVVASLIEGLADRNVEVTLYTAKQCNLGCNVIYPIGISDENFGQEIGSDRLSTYSRRIRYDLESRSFDVVNNHYDPVTFTALQGLRTPVVTTIHGPASANNIEIFGKFYESHFSAVSNSQKCSYPSNMNFVGAGFVHNSIDNDHPFSARKGTYLLSISRIEPIKGQEAAIEIARRCRLDLILAGNIIDEEYFHRTIQPNLGTNLSKPGRETEREDFIANISTSRTVGSHVTYIGEINEQERDQLMKHARAFLFPIEVEESFGLVVIEAGIAGTPVIAFNRGAIPEIIEQGKTGFYGDTIDELVRFTVRSSEVNPADCREHVEKYFNTDRMVEGYLKLYRQVFAANQSTQDG